MFIYFMWIDNNWVENGRGGTTLNVASTNISRAIPRRSLPWFDIKIRPTWPSQSVNLPLKIAPPGICVSLGWRFSKLRPRSSRVSGMRGRMLSRALYNLDLIVSQCRRRPMCIGTLKRETSFWKPLSFWWLKLCWFQYKNYNFYFFNNL